MKTLFVFVLLFSGLSTIEITQAAPLKDEKANFYLSYCINNGPGVNYSYQSCINSNFSSIAREIGGYFPFCTNSGVEVDYGFTSCVNYGFRETQRQLNNKIWLQDCSNFDRTTLDYSFVYCVNSNFSQIHREIDQLQK